MSSINYVQADLRFLLPIKPGQRVAVLGHAPGLVMALDEAEADCTLVLDDKLKEGSDLPCNPVQVSGDHLPFTAVSLHHLFIPQLSATQAPWLAKEIRRVLKPEGWLFVGVRNRHSFHQLHLGKSNRYSLTLAQLKQLLPSPYWQIHQCYGVHDDLQHPQYLIPLDMTTAVSYFYQQIFMPNSLAGAWIQRLAQYLNQLGGNPLLFKDLGITAQQI